MKELHGQALSETLAESDRIASGIPGQVAAKNILFSKFWTQLKKIFGVTVWEAREFRSSPALVVVDNVQYILNESIAPLPFASTDFATELSAGKWINLGGVNQHHDLLNLDSFDDHLQYFKNAGRATPQTIANQVIKLGDNGRIEITPTATDYFFEKNSKIGYLSIQEAITLLRHSVLLQLYGGTANMYLNDQGVEIRPVADILKNTFFNLDGSISNAWLTAQFANKQVVNPGVCATCWLNESDIVLDETNRTLTIATFNGGAKTINSTNIFNAITDGDGNSVVHPFTAQLVFNWIDTNGIWYFYINSSGQLIATQTPWFDFNIIAPLYRLYWNNTLISGKKIVRAIPEYHPNTISADDHDWKHSYGSIWQRGFEI